MSAGRFERTRYIASYDTDAIHPIRVQPETTDLSLAATPATTNAPPVQPISNPISAVSSRGQRQLGLRPRTVTMELVSSPPPTGYDERSIVTLPILNLTLFAALFPGVELAYLGATWEVVGVTPEIVR